MDCVIPFAAKDRGTLPWCVKGIRANVPGVERVYVVGAHAQEGPVRELGLDVQFLAEEAVVENVCGGERPDFYGWHLQQLIKLGASHFVQGSRWLVVDSDTIFLNPTPLVVDGRVVFSTDDGLGDVGGHGLRCRDYRMLYESLVGLPFQHERCCVAHHMVFDREHVDALLRRFKLQPWWRVLEHPGGVYRRFSEYDFYASFLKSTAPDSFVLEPSRGRWLNAVWSWWDDRDATERLFSIYRERGWRYVSCHEWMRHGRRAGMEAALEFAQRCDDAGAELSLVRWRDARRTALQRAWHRVRLETKIAYHVAYLHTLGRGNVRV